MKNQQLSPWVRFVLLLCMIGFVFGKNREIYLVLMEEDPVAFYQGSATVKEGKIIDYKNGSDEAKVYAKKLVSSHDELLKSNLEVGSYRKLYSFYHIVNGFAVHTSPSQAQKLRSCKGVRLMEKDRGAKLMTTYTPQFLGLPTGAWTAQGGMTNAGEGIVIGIVDTGIDPTHPSFAYDSLNPFKSNIPHFSGSCEVGPHFPAGSCNGKIISARYFSAGAASSFPLNASRDFLSPYDAVGHGSHVASIAAGNSGVQVVVNGCNYGSASGMAPRARIAVYKAIFPDVGTLADVVSAIDQAAEDGVDVLSLSIGPDGPPEGTLTFLNMFDIFLLYAQRAGIFVVQAAGNSGPGEATVVSFSPWVMGVAASSTDRSYSGTLVLGNSKSIPGVGLSEPTFGDGLLQYKLVLAKDAAIASGSSPETPAYAEECQHPEALQPAIVQGSIVICSFSTGFLNGTSTVTAIINTAKVLGFMGFVFVANPQLGDFIAEPIPFSVPGIMIPMVSDVLILLDYYEEQTNRDSRGVVMRYGGRAAIGDGRIASFNHEAPIVSRFSSRGPDIMDANRNQVDVLKPEILAPGHHVWAAWSPPSAVDSILMGYNFALLSGTSQATPHVAGIAALVKQSHPSWSPATIFSAIATTALKNDNQGKPIMAEGPNINQLYPATPFDYGAGLVNPARSLDPGLVFSSGFEDYISFLCSLPGVNPEAIRSATGKTCTSRLPSPSDLNLPSITISALVGFKSVQRTVTNVAARVETYLCSILPPRGVDIQVFPSWFTIAPQETQHLDIKFNVTEAINAYSFGEIVLTGSFDHIVRFPVSVFPVSRS